MKSLSMCSHCPNLDYRLAVAGPVVTGLIYTRRILVAGPLVTGLH